MQLILLYCQSGFLYAYRVCILLNAIYGSHIHDWSRMRIYEEVSCVGTKLEIKDVRYSWCLSIMEMGEADHSKTFGLYELFLMCINLILGNYMWSKCTFTDSKSVHCRTVNIPLIFHLYLIKKRHRWYTTESWSLAAILKLDIFLSRLIKKS